jgi:hypothetical protein
VWLHWTCALYSPQVALEGTDPSVDPAAHAAALSAGADADAVSSWYIGLLPPRVVVLVVASFFIGLYLN